MAHVVDDPRSQARRSGKRSKGEQGLSPQDQVRRLEMKSRDRRRPRSADQDARAQSLANHRGFAILGQPPEDPEVRRVFERSKSTGGEGADVGVLRGGTRQEDGRESLISHPGRGPDRDPPVDERRCVRPDHRVRERLSILESGEGGKVQPKFDPGVVGTARIVAADFQNPSRCFRHRAPKRLADQRARCGKADAAKGLGRATPGEGIAVRKSRGQSRHTFRTSQEAQSLGGGAPNLHLGVLEAHDYSGYGKGIADASGGEDRSPSNRGIRVAEERNQGAAAEGTGILENQDSRECLDAGQRIAQAWSSGPSARGARKLQHAEDEGRDQEPGRRRRQGVPHKELEVKCNVRDSPIPMKCPACSRPVAMARGNCMYCGAPLPQEILDAAAGAAERVLQSRSLAGLETAAKGPDADQVPKRYVVIDTSITSPDIIASACSVSIWEARQWQANSRYRLLKISQEAGEDRLESNLRGMGLEALVVSGETVARARNPIPIESIDVNAQPTTCLVRENPEALPSRREMRERAIALIVSGPIKREKQRPQTSKVRLDSRLEDAWLVHIHLHAETRPWELDPRRTAFEGPGLASAHMQTVELVRRLKASVAVDETFRNVVPALSPGVDPMDDLPRMKNEPGKPQDKQEKAVILDNVAQFREYSAWRAAIERLRPGMPPEDL